MRNILFLGVLLITFSLNAQVQPTNSDDKIIIEITGPSSNGIWTVKSCFPDTYRNFELNNSKINNQWKYKAEPYFADDGCYTLLNRSTPTEEDITTHILSITTIKSNQLSFNYIK